MKTLPICSVSGGKDSTALYCLMIETFGQDFLPIFADTGHEHPVTLNYVRELPHLAQGPEVQFVRADFGPALARRGLVPTGHTYLDMALVKNSFPTGKRQFCTELLKLWPIKFYLHKNYPDHAWEMYTGIRAGESEGRSKMQPFSWNNFFDCLSILPMLYQTEEEQFAYLQAKNVPPNPLYALGYNRVGCFPCIHANKKQLSLLPDWAWERLRHYEQVKGMRFFSKFTLDYLINWSKTSHGGRQFDMFKSETNDAPSCMTGWMACE